MNSTTLSNVIYLKRSYGYTHKQIAELTGITELQVQSALDYAKFYSWSIPAKFYPGFEAYVEEKKEMSPDQKAIVNNLQVICHILYREAIRHGRRKKINLV